MKEKLQEEKSGIEVELNVAGRQCGEVPLK